MAQLYIDARWLSNKLDMNWLNFESESDVGHRPGRMAGWK